MWANKVWSGELFKPGTRSADFLRQYSSVFTTVEGNTTFYALPRRDTVLRWRDETPNTFRFCLKFPRTISHDKRLLNTDADVEHFFSLFAPLGTKIGPFFLQLRPTFGAAEMDSLEDFLRKLPRHYRYAVEVRSREYFDNGRDEQAFVQLLSEHGVDRVIFDTSGLFATALSNDLIEESKRKKPNMPVRFSATGQHPFIRICGDPLVEADINTDILTRWVDAVAAWIREGKTPYVFIHSAPDDFFAPRIARRFHAMLAERVAVGAMPMWPAETNDNEQMSLF